MAEFQSKFDSKNPGHRHKMLGTLIALSMEIETGRKFSNKGDFLPHLKQIEWLPKSVRTKKDALKLLVDLSVQGFGYVPKGRVAKILEAEQKQVK